MDWKSKKTEENSFSVKTFNAQFEDENESVIDHESMFGHVHAKIQSNHNPESVKELSTEEHNRRVLQGIFSDILDVIEEKDVEDSDNMSVEDIKKEMKARPQPGIIIPGQREKVVEKIKEESNDILDIEKKDEKNVEIDKEKVKKEKEKKEDEYDKEVYNKLVELDKTGDYGAVIEYLLDVKYKTTDTDQEISAYNAINKYTLDLANQLEKRKKYITELGKISVKYNYQKSLEVKELERKIKDGEVPETESIRQDEDAVAISCVNENNFKKNYLQSLSAEFTDETLSKEEFNNLIEDGKKQEIKRLSEENNKSEEEIRRLVTKAEDSGAYDKNDKTIGYEIYQGRDKVQVLKVSPWRHIKNMLVKEGDDSPSLAEYEKAIKDNDKVWEKYEKGKELANLGREQARIILKRYGKDLESLKEDDDIHHLLLKLQVLTEGTDNMSLDDLGTCFSNISYNARSYRRSHGGWFRKRWGASKRVFKLTKNLEGFGNYYHDKYEEIVGKGAFDTGGSLKPYAYISISDNLQLAKQIKDRRDKLRKQNENEINTNSDNIIEDPEPILLNENAKKTTKKKKTQKKYNVDREAYAILYALRDDALQARSSGNNSPQYGAFLQIFNDLQLTAFDIYHKNGNKEELLKLYASQVHDLKLAAKAYVDYKYSYRTEDQTKEPGKDKLNKQDRKKLKVVKRVLKYSFSSKVPKLITIDDKDENLQDHEPELINIRVNEEDNIISTDKQEGAAYEAMTMTYDQNVLGDKISRKEFEKSGGAVKHRYVTEAEANRIVEDSHGFMAAKKVAGKNGIVEIVPSLPEYTTLYKGKESEKRIPLRKTIKTMFKTIAHLLTDSKGRIKTDLDEYNGKSIAAWIDDITKAAPVDFEYIEDLQGFQKEVIIPEIEKVLQKEYKSKSVKNYKAKASADAKEVCKNYFELAMGTNGASFKMPLTTQTFDGFVKINTFIKTAKANDIMNLNGFKKLTIDGRPLTKKEVETALKEFKEQADANVAEFAQIRNIDTDSVEMPGFGSCDDNANFKNALMNGFVSNDKSHLKIEHQYMGIVKSDPEKALDLIVKDLDNIIDTAYNGEKAAENKKIILELDKKRKVEALSENDKKKIKVIYYDCIKYECNVGANVAMSENTLYTEETYASNPDQLQ